MSTYLLIGDSQAVGIEDELRAEMEARGWRQAGAYVRVGLSTRDAAAQVRALPRADLAIVVLGGNDTAGAPLEQAIRGLLAAVPADRVVWVGPMAARDPELHARKAAVARLQQSLIGSWLDGFALSAGLEYAPDGVHLTNASHAIVARVVAGWAFATASPWRTAVSVALALVGGAALGFGAYAFTRSLG